GKSKLRAAPVVAVGYQDGQQRHGQKHKGSSTKEEPNEHAVSHLCVRSFYELSFAWNRSASGALPSAPSRKVSYSFRSASSASARWLKPILCSDGLILMILN